MVWGRENCARAIDWPAPGEVVVVGDRRLPKPGPNDVVIDVAVTVTSTGTELARFRSLPNADVRYPHKPGFMAAGTVVTGRADLAAGTVVALRRTSHQSPAVASRDDVHVIPAGVAPLDGALWHLGVIALYGLARGDYIPGQPLAILGAGILGALVRRFALAMGTSDCLVVAHSSAKRWTVTDDPGTSFLALSEGSLDDARERYPLTIDATGSAHGLETSAAVTGPGGCIVLLGSPRAERSTFPVASVQERGIRVVGAHIDTLKLIEAQEGGPTDERLTEAFFAHLADGVSFTDLVQRHDPDEARYVYEVAARQRSFVAAGFVWSGDPQNG